MNKPAILAVDAASATTPARFTTEEFVALIEHAAPLGLRLELIEGELARMSPPMSAHSSRQLATASSLYQLLKATTRQAMVEIGIDIGNETVLVADIAVTKGPIEGNRLVLASEVALIVEVTQTSATRDKGLKRLAYARAGIARYWVIDGNQSMTYVYANPVDGDYDAMHTVRFGEPLTVPGTDSTIVID